MKRALVLAVCFALSGVAQAVGATSASANGRETFIDYGDVNWTSKQVEHGAIPDFQDRTYTSDGFVESSAAFGYSGTQCPASGPSAVHTPWTPDTDILLRQTFALAPTHAEYVKSLVLKGVIEGSLDVYLNGQFVKHVKGNVCRAVRFQVKLTPYMYDRDCCSANFNDLAVRASSSAAQDSDYVDMAVQGVVTPGD